MNLRFGILWPFRNPHFNFVPWQDLYRSHLDLIVESEAMGYDNAWLTEHHFVDDGYSPSLLPIAGAVAARTSRIRIGTFLILLPLHNPVRIAEDTATVDLMSNGRFDLGVGLGYRVKEFADQGVSPTERGARLQEGIGLIQRLLSDEEVTFEGKFSQLNKIQIVPPALQKPHPPILVTAVAPYSKGVTAAAARGWDPISANFLQPKWVKTHWPQYEKGCMAANRIADPTNWRVAKSIFVADTEQKARKYVLANDGPYYHYYKSLSTKLIKAGRANLFKTDQNQSDVDLELDEIVQQLVIFGTPEKVTDQLLAFRDDVGPFGTLLYAGHDWKDRELAVRSMELMATKVVPAINLATGE